MTIGSVVVALLAIMLMIGLAHMIHRRMDAIDWGLIGAGSLAVVVVLTIWPIR